MQIVIDIDDMAYKFVQNTTFVEDVSTLFEQTKADREKTLYLFDILDAIKNGTPLPKGHGRLIDAEVFVNNIVKYSHQSTKTIGQSLADTPTIIEADKAGEEE